MPTARIAGAIILMVAAVAAAPCLVGCGHKEQPTTPQQTEQLRQQTLKKGKSFSQEKRIGQ